MKFYQTHFRHEVENNRLIHCINYIKAKNKEDALEVIRQHCGIKKPNLDEDEFYVLEVSKKTIKDQANHHLKCSAHWKQKIDKAHNKIEKRVFTISHQATQNWANILLELIKETK